jgi:hypothetical protein
MNQTYPSPRDEVAVFDLGKKEWLLKQANPYEKVRQSTFRFQA